MKEKFKQENTTEVGFKYEKYISDYFMKHGYYWATPEIHPSWKGAKPVDVLNLDGICIECKWDSIARIPKFMEQAIRIGKKEDDNNKKKVKSQNHNKGKERIIAANIIEQDPDKWDEIDIEELQFLKNVEEEKPLMPVVFYKRRKGKEENPNPDTEDYVTMRLEDWIKLYKAYQEKEHPELIKTIKIECLEK